MDVRRVRTSPGNPNLFSQQGCRAPYIDKANKGEFRFHC